MQHISDFWKSGTIVKVAILAGVLVVLCLVSLAIFHIILITSA